MKKINALIVDDEPKCIQALTALLKAHDDISILGSARDMKTALPLIEKHRNSIDILFLDIQMPHGNGFTLLQHIDNIPFKVIFTTAYDQYAIQAIRFSALDYLLKPIDDVELALALDRFRTSSSGSETYNAIETFRTALIKKDVFEKLAIPTSKDIMLFHLDHILYMESDNNYTTVCLHDGRKIVSSRNIGYYEELLESKPFMRIHNSYIVNTKKIVRFTKGKSPCVELENGQIIDVAASKKEKLLSYIQMM